MLIDCPECGGKISEQAKTCPHCAYQIAPTFGDNVERSLRKLKSFFDSRQHQIGFMLLLGGAISPLFFDWNWDDELLTSIVIAHLIPLGLLLMIPRWKKLVLILLLVLSFVDVGFSSWLSVYNFNKPYRSSREAAVFMAVWSALALCNTIFLVVKIRDGTDNYARRAVVALGKTILVVLLICVMLILGRVIYVVSM